MQYLCVSKQMKWFLLQFVQKATWNFTFALTITIILCVCSHIAFFVVVFVLFHNCNRNFTILITGFEIYHWTKKNRSSDKKLSRNSLMWTRKKNWLKMYRLQIIFGAGNPSARHVILMFWFSRTATDDGVLSISKMFGGTTHKMKCRKKCNHSKKPGWIFN